MKVNKATLIGNIGKDVEVKTFEGGGKIASFTLATTERYKNKQGEKVEETQWHNIVVRGALADIAEKYLKKGDRIGLDGKIVYRKYTDKEGNDKYITEVICYSFLMLSNNKSGTMQESMDEVDDLPF